MPKIAVSLDIRVRLGLDYVRKKMLDGGSNRQSLYFTWQPGGLMVFFNLALKKPAGCSFWLRRTQRVAPSPLILTELSVMIQSWSSGFGRAMDLLDASAPWQEWNHYQDLISPDDCVLRLTASHKRLKSSEILCATTQDLTKHFIGANEGAQTANVLERLTRP